MDGLSIDRLRALLRYDPGSGNFIWLVTRGRLATAGSIAGRMSQGYRQITIDGRAISAHRLVFFYHGEVVPDYVDHVNGNRSDNRRENLRPATKQQNKFNAKYRNGTGLVGVSEKRFVGSVKYQASFRAKGMSGGKYLGLFATPEEAHAAYLIAASEHYGADFTYSTDRAIRARD